jgi:hypothetical protein
MLSHSEHDALVKLAALERRCLLVGGGGGLEADALGGRACVHLEARFSRQADQLVPKGVLTCFFSGAHSSLAREARLMACMHLPQQRAHTYEPR